MNHLSESQILRQISQNEQSILEAQRKAQSLANENTRLRAALNRRRNESLLSGFPVGHIAVIVSGGVR